MKKIITTTAIAAAVVVLGTATGAQAASPTCADEFGWKNHGEHVLNYVEPGEIAGGAPAHRDGHAPPGASFCLGLDDHRPGGG